MPIKHLGYQNLLYRKFVSPGEHDAKRAAQAIGESLSSLYNYIEGISYCPPDIISRLYNATKDTEFLSFIVDDTDQALTERRQRPPGKSVLEEALDVAAAIGGLVHATKGALDDGRISEADRTKILRAIEKGHNELEDLKSVIRKVS
ncbi:MAG: phage regulatory CII family protein [Deltaproteobacteria bacterium]